MTDRQCVAGLFFSFADDASLQVFVAAGSTLRCCAAIDVARLWCVPRGRFHDAVLREGAIPLGARNGSRVSFVQLSSYVGPEPILADRQFPSYVVYVAKMIIPTKPRSRRRRNRNLTDCPAAFSAFSAFVCRDDHALSDRAADHQGVFEQLAVRTPVVRPFHTKTAIILPRQARDKHRKSWKRVHPSRRDLPSQHSLPVVS